MRHTRSVSSLLGVLALVLSVLALAPLTAAAQPGPITQGTPTTVYVPAQDYGLFWDAAQPQSAEPENAVVGYQLAAFTETTSGVTRRTWDIGNVLTFAVPGADLGTVRQYLSLRAKAANGLYSTYSNTLPFQPASAPGVPGRLRRTATP